MTYLETEKRELDKVKAHRAIATRPNRSGGALHAPVHATVGSHSQLDTFEEDTEVRSELDTVVRRDGPAASELAQDGTLESARHLTPEQRANVHAGLRKRTRVALVVLVTAALIAAAVFTARALAASSSTNFAGVLAAETPPVQLNVPVAGVLQTVDVTAGQHVRVGQVLATQSSSVAAATVMSDKLQLASDEERLAALLGPSAATSDQQAAHAYQTIETLAASQLTRGAQAVDSAQSLLAAAQQRASTWTTQLSAATSAFDASCTSTKGSGCLALHRSIVSDQSTLAAANARVSRDQTTLRNAKGTATTLTSVAIQEESLAQKNQSAFTATMAVDLSEARDAVSQDQERLAADLQSLEYTTLTSPVSGVVQAVSGQDGEMVQPGGGRSSASATSDAIPGIAVPITSSPTSVNLQGGGTQPLITLEAGNQVDAIAQVPEQDIARVVPGRSASISVDSLGGRVYRAEIRAIEPEPVDVQGAVYYDVVLVSSGHRWGGGLLPGMTINVHIP